MYKQNVLLFLSVIFLEPIKYRELFCLYVNKRSMLPGQGMNWSASKCLLKQNPA